MFNDILSNPDEEWEDEELDDENSRQVMASYACEECDYRWDVMEENREYSGEDYAEDTVCPMCGSTYVTQI